MTRYNQNSDDKDGSKAEFRRKIEFDDHDLNMFAGILAWESDRQATPVFYHAATAELNNLWHSFTHMRELITLKPFVGRNVVLRGTDLYFRGVKSMPEMINAMGKHDYENGKANKVLCTNYVMTAGLATTRSTSSSMEYQLNDHSVNAPDSEAKFDEAMSLAGIIADYAYFRSAFLQFLAHRHAAKENSVMFGISIPEALLQDNSCTDSHRRDFPDGAVVEDGKVLSVNANHVYSAIQKELESQKDVAESFEVRRDEKRALIPEARLSLHPDFIHHPAVRIQTFSRFPIEQSEQRLFNQEVRNATIGTMSDWLQSQQQVMPDSFVQYPAIKRLFNAAYKAMTGQDAPERLAARGLKHLINNGHLEAVREFLKLNPDLVDMDDFPLIDMSHQAIRAGNMDILKYLCEEFGATSAQEFYKDQDGYIQAIRCCLLAKSDMCLTYLFAHYDPTKIPQSTVESLVKYIYPTDHQFGKLLYSYFPSLKKKIIGLLFSKDLEEEALDDFVGQACGPEELFYELTKDNQGKKPNYLRDKLLVKMLVDFQGDLTKMNPETKEPYIFGLRLFDSENIRDYAGEFRKRLPEMLQCRDRSGRDIIHYAQESINKKEKNALLRLLVIAVGHFSSYMTDEQNGKDAIDTSWRKEFFVALDEENIDKLAQLLQHDVVDLDMFDGLLFLHFPHYENHPTILKRLMQIEKKRKKYEKMKRKVADALDNADLRTIYWYLENRPLIFTPVDLNLIHMTEFLERLQFLEETHEGVHTNQKLGQMKRERKKLEMIMNRAGANLKNSKASREKRRRLTAKITQVNRTIDETKDELAKLDRLQKDEERLYKKDLSNIYKAFDELRMCRMTIDDSLKLLNRNINDPTVIRYFLGAMLYNPDMQVTLDFLETNFPNRDDFIALTTTTIWLTRLEAIQLLKSSKRYAEVFSDASPFELVCKERFYPGIHAIASYMSDRLYELLAQMDGKSFGRALVCLPKAKVRELYDQHSDLFATSEEGRDFFGSSLIYLPNDLIEDLVQKNFSKLFSLAPRTGIPYFWEIAYGNCRYGDGALAKKLIARDHKLLELRNVDGMTIADYAKLTGTEKVIEKVLKCMNRG